MSSAKPPKTMSSRLMTMKFMQRAAASPNTPPSNHTTDSPDAPSSKRRKVSESSSPYTYTPSRTESRILQEALDAEEAKRQDALDRAMVGGRETKWELSCLPAPRNGGEGRWNVRVLSRAEIERDDDDDDDEDEEEGGVDGAEDGDEQSVKRAVNGRMTFGRAPTPVEDEREDEGGDEKGSGSGSGSDSNPNSDQDSNSEDEDEDDEEPPASKGPYLPISNPRPTHASAVQASRKARNKKKRDLNKIDSVSASNSAESTPIRRKGISAVSAATNGKGRPTGFSGTCFACGKQGHAKRDCPLKNGGKS